MELNVTDDECWVCGKKFVETNYYLRKTDHHTLPKRLKPKKNVIVPVCKRCPDFINMEDVRGLYSFAYKIDKTLGDMRTMSKEFFDLVSSKFKKLGKNKNNPNNR